MNATQSDHLPSRDRGAVLSPGQLGPVTLRNRVFSSAHQTSLVRDHVPTDDLRAYHEERARGGIGAIFLEATAVHASGLLTAKTMGGYLPEIVEPLAAVTRAVQRNGAKIFVQLFHGGREQIASAPKAAALAPSAVPSARFHVEPRAMDAEDIAELVAGYALSARHMAEAGLDGVEISASHAYLPAQFIAPRTNLRTDDYGGELRNRLRFLLEVIAAVRANLSPDMALGVRVALDEISPGAMGYDECAEVSEILAREAGIDFISLVVGDSATYQGSTFIAPRASTMPASIIERLHGIKARLGGNVSVLATTRITELDEADAAVARGALDFVGMTRAHIADPHLIRKAQDGASAIPCIGCNVGCIGHYHAGLPIACVMNVATGRERTTAQPVRIEPIRSAGNLAVLGAGPAGIAAAVAGSEAGKNVTVFEKTGAIGGQLRLAGTAPDHAAVWEAWSTWARTGIAENQIEVLLGQEPDPGILAGFDEVVVATGARPYRDRSLWATDTVHTVLDAWEVLESPGAVQGPVLVADWGGDPTGLDCAEVLLGRGLEVQYSYAGPSPTEQVHQYQRNGYLGRLDNAGLVLLPHLELSTSDGELTLRNVFSGRLVEIDPAIRTIVASHGRVPHTYAGCAELAGPVSVVGDALGPRTLEEAMLEGTLAGGR
ncbi:FAD-dependent oxidoreductase [Paeniglutamicibacter cryotolerans]|uniref:2,4-dienoyl-CoA reductase-like NADH-dependent reductase (Old Yellow Enzyme family) n=1 Tax=Paeniglutamicibacter cryotolerans TaxID=670079 RepID=A0A839QRN7_9MICC|nr:FAD-dependent oxidoreductase [Paeniglutamicibacter cryotolerans]MBB2994731.1 2,4-dienoyl-CoA reductase-like NADH-dependent reductase (Old Yellow Enzyme family) [Paeniglutamicibacter cryotolerans]